MEYDKHPEVNAAWRKFCREAILRPPARPDVSRFKQRTRRANALQGSRWYWKDSPHTNSAAAIA